MNLKIQIFCFLVSIAALETSCIKRSISEVRSESFAEVYRDDKPVYDAHVVNLALAAKSLSHPSLNPLAREKEDFRSFQHSSFSATKCAACHAEQHKEWRASNHALAAEDPLFNWLELKMNLLRDGAFLPNETAQMPNFCTRCHAPAAAHDGSVTRKDRTVIAQLKDTKAEHVIGAEGVSCFACHSAIAEIDFNEKDSFRKLGFSDGINFIKYSADEGKVITGNRRILNRDKERVEDPNASVASEYPKLPSLHKIEIKRIKDQRGMKSSIGGSGSSVTLCNHCHTLRVAPSSGTVPAADGYVYEQIVGPEWQRTNSFGRFACIDCHMRYPFEKSDIELFKDHAQALTKDALPKTVKDALDAKTVFGRISSISSGAPVVARAQHEFAGGYVPAAVRGLSVEERRRRNIQRLKMYQGAVSFEIIAESKQNCDQVSLGARLVSNGILGHYVPSGLNQIRELWVETEVRCGQKALFSSGKVSDASDEIVGESIDFVPMSQYYKNFTGAHDFKIPVIAKERQDQVIAFNHIFLNAKPEKVLGKQPSPDQLTDLKFYQESNLKKHRSLDFSAPQFLRAFQNGSPLGSAHTGGNEASAYGNYPAQNWVGICQEQKVEVSSRLKLRFFAPWVLKDIVENIKWGRETNGAKGFPTAALEDIKVGLVTEITDEDIQSNEIFTVDEQKKWVELEGCGGR